MDSINLASYIIKFKKISYNIEENIYLDWDNLLYDEQQQKLVDDSVDVISLLKNRLVKNKLFKSNNNKTLELDDIFFEDDKVFGRIYYGKYGERQKAVCIKDPSREDKDIPENMSVMKQFYFLFYFPKKNRNKVILILERKGNIGIKYIFEQWIKKEVFSKWNKYFKIEIQDCIPTKLLNEYINNGEFLSFEFIGIKSHNDSFNILNPELNEIHGKLNIEFKIDQGFRKNAKNFVKKFLNGEIVNTTDNFIEISNETKDNFKTTIKYRNKTKVFSFGSSNNFKPYLDITGDIINFSGGIPNLEDIHNIALDHAKYLLNEEVDQNE